MRKGLLAILIGFVLLSCGDGDVIILINPEIQFEKDSIKIIEYLRSKGYSDDQIGNTDNGIRYVILDEGTGEKIDESDFVEYNYLGKTLGDTIFDTSIEHIYDSLKDYYDENPIVQNDDTIFVFNRIEFEPFFITYSSSGWTTPTNLISGWGEGIAASFKGLGVNGKALIVIPSASAYEGRGAGIFIGPNTPIAFELTPVKITKQP